MTLSRILFISFIFSCLYTLSAIPIQRTQTNSTGIQNYKLANQLYTKNDTSENVLSNSTYRITYGDPTLSLNKQWFELYEKDGEYFIDYAKFSIKKGVDECTGDKIKTITSNRNTLVYLNYSELKPGKITHKFIEVEDKIITPRTSVRIKEKNNDEFLISTIHYLKPNLPENTNNWEDYEGISVDVATLYNDGYSSNSQKLFWMNECLDGYIIVDFIGDIDRDGKYDIIFHIATNYEEQTIIVFLSSLAKGNQIVGELGRITRIFDC